MWKSYLKLIVSMLIFGSIGIFVRGIPLSTVELVFYRVVIASIFILGLMLIKRKKPFNCSKKTLKLAAFSGIIMGINWLLFFQALRYTTIAIGTMTYYLAPILVLFLAPFILNERLTKKQLATAMLTPLGLALIVFSSTSTSEVTYNHTLGLLFGIGSAVFYALLILCNKKLEDIDNLDKTFIQLISATITLSPVLIIYHDFNRVFTHLPMLLVLGILHTGIACYFYFTGLKETPTQLTAVLSYIDPVSAVFFAALFLNESLNGVQIIGTAIVLVSTYLCSQTKAKEE